MPDLQKQTVQWFPGHMAKTRRQIKESLPLVDCVTELLDARVPLASHNPELDALTERKPRIVLLNKCDMADEETTQRWVEWFRARGQGAEPLPHVGAPCPRREDRTERGTRDARKGAARDGRRDPEHREILVYQPHGG